VIKKETHDRPASSAHPAKPHAECGTQRGVITGNQNTNQNRVDGPPRSLSATMWGGHPAPWLLIGVRLLLAPAIVTMAFHRWRGVPLAFAIVGALLSDVYDGVIARKLGVESTGLRRADSIADTIFYGAAAMSAWILVPKVVRSMLGVLTLLIVLECLRYAFDYRKFRREASYHSYSAKLWGLVLATALVLQLAFNVAGGLLRIAIWIGVLSDIEGLAISIILPVWARDVRSFAHALRLRKRFMAAAGG